MNTQNTTQVNPYFQPKLSNVFPAVSFLELTDVAPDTYANNQSKVLAVNNDATGIGFIDPSSIVDTVVGLGTARDIPVWTGGLNPIFQDSGMSIDNISFPNPPESLPLQAHYINLKPSAGVDQIIASVYDPNTSNDLVLVGVGALTGNADLQITNQSTAPNKILGVTNSSPNGTVYVSGETALLNNNGSVTVEVSNSGAGIYDGLNQNYIISNSSGINLNTNNNANPINIYSNNDDVNIIAYESVNIRSQSPLTIQSLADDVNIISAQTTRINANEIDLTSTNNINITASNAGSVITLTNVDGGDSFYMNSAGINLLTDFNTTSNSKTMNLNTTDQMAIYTSNGNDTITMNAFGITVNNNNDSQLVLNNGLTSVLGKFQVLLSETTDNHYISLANNGIDLSQNSGNNRVTMDSSGITINNNNQSNLLLNNGLTSLSGNTQILLSDSTNDTMVINSTGISLNNNNVSKLSLANGLTTLNGKLQVLLLETTNNHLLSLDNNGVIVTANNGKKLSLNTDGNCQFKINSSNGLSGQVLTSDGTNCKWQNLPSSTPTAPIPQILKSYNNFLVNGSLSGILRIFNEAGQSMPTSGVANTINTISYIRIDPADYPVVGAFTPKLQLVSNVITNGTAPACNFTYQLYEYTSSGLFTTFTVTAGAVFGNSAVVNAPIASTTTSGSSALFSLPVTAKNYILIMTNSANTASFTQHSVFLKLVYV